MRRGGREGRREGIWKGGVGGGGGIEKESEEARSSGEGREWWRDGRREGIEEEGCVFLHVVCLIFGGWGIFRIGGRE